MLKLFNTLSRKKEVFEPREEGKVNLYVCGPTVYDYAHLGHAKTYLFFDMLRRYLEFLGYEVFYVQNITDVGHLTGDSDVGEDKILKRARRERLKPMELVEIYMREYFRDMDDLNVRRPNVSPRATGHIIEMIQMTETLMEKGFAYESGGSVYFDVSKAEHYGELSNQNPDELLSGARVKVDPNKKSPLDFALWKSADKDHLMQWPSPWGSGFPGWHIECSVMSSKYLGGQIDVHGGAVELSFPHHENEIAQSEAATGKRPFVKYWVHTGLLNIDGRKMSKSLGNFVTVKNALGEHSPDVLRFFVLSSHYRSPLDYSERSLEEAAASYGRLMEGLRTMEEKLSAGGGKDDLREEIDALDLRFMEAMDDDFNTPNAFASLFDLVSLVHSSSPDRRSLEMARSLFSKAGEIFGLFEKRKADSELVSGLIEKLVELREEAREEKTFEKSDSIRSDLAELGVELQDTPEGVKWRLKP